MINLRAFGLLFTFSFLLTLNNTLHADSNDGIYGSCGKKPNLWEKLSSDADKVRQKCIDDIFTANKEKIRLEIEEIAKIMADLSKEISKVAIKSTLTITQCTPRPAEPDRDPKKIKKCNELVNLHNALADRMAILTGWREAGAPKYDDKNANKSITLPCPSDDKMAELRQAATFNRKLFKTWENCRASMIDKM